jgi:DNA modification methylase
MNKEEMLNKVICGDCLEVMKDIPDKSIDLTVTSPPYDNLRDYNGYTFDFEGIAKELYRITKEGGVVVWVVGDATIKGSETGTSFKQALYFKEIGFNLHDTMIWRKPNPMPYIKKDTYTPSFEYMFVLSKGKPKTFNLLREDCKYAGKILKTNTTNPESIRKPNQTKPTKDTKIKSNVWDYVVAGTNYGHPAIFPEKLAEDHILTWSNEGDTILDPMAGSGTTLKMAKKNNRNYIGIEISPEYIDIINKRL